MSTKKPLLLALGLLSAATLALEIDLARLFAVAQFHHFAFMIVSLALLGFGASGTLLTLLPGLRARDPERTLAAAGWGFALTATGAYLLTLYMPFDSFRVALDWRQWGVLALHYLALSTPFLCSGLAVGLLLVAYPAQSSRIYAVNLAGSAAGCLLAVSLSTWLGSEGVLLVAGALGAIAALACAWARYSGAPGRIAHIAAIALLLWAALRLPPWLQVRLSPYKGLSYTLLYPDAERVYQRWNSISRVDVVRSTAIRSLPGSGYLCPHPPPAQLALAVDGDSLAPISHVEPGFTDLPFTGCLLTALPYRLRPGARALVMEPRGGFDVLVALGQGARHVTAVEANPLVVRAVREQGAWAGHVYDDPRVRVFSESGRSFVRQTGERYDVIDLALTEPQHTVVSGAYSLAENYAYTVEAFVDYLERLDEDGLLVVTRWLQVPPSESIRAFGLAVEAVERAGGNPQTDVIALRSYQQMLILVRRGPFSAGERQAIRRFAAERRFDLVYLPDLQPGEVNRHNVLPAPDYYDACLAVVRAEDRDEWLGAYPFDVRPPSDDHPFFGHLFKWQQTAEALAMAGRIWQPFGGVGYLMPLALLALAVLSAVALILGPLALSRAGAMPQKGAWRTLAYFLFLGLGYLCVEIPLMQRFILFLGQPTWSMATVLGGLLAFSGIGSRLSRRVPLRAALFAIPLLVGAMVVGLPSIFERTLSLPLWVRLLVALGALAPLGLLMGMPFPAGIAALDDAQLIAWAWAGNGATSVIASIGAAVISLGWGFSAVLILGAGCYLGAMATCPARPRR